MRLAWLVLASAPAWAQAGGIERLVDEYREKERAPGISVAVLTRAGEIDTVTRGWADLENEVAVSPVTVFRLASVVKPFTAVAAMRLVEEGRLDLDAPVEKYVAAWPAKQWPVTTRQLLGHLGGVRGYREDGSDNNSTRHYWSTVEALTAFSADPLAHEPGTKYLYSSYGFNLAGGVVEKASGLAYAAAVAAFVLRPAGIETMRIDDVFSIIPNRARGYRRNPAGEIENCSLADNSLKAPGAGWVATAIDVVKFARALMDGRLVKPETLEQMFERQKLKDGSRTGYGLGFGINREKAPRIYSHSGGQQGTSTYLAFSPELKTAVAVLVNLEGANPRGLAEAVLAELEK